VRTNAILYRIATLGLPCQSALKDLGISLAVRGGADLWQSVAARLVMGSPTYLRDGDSPEVMSRWAATSVPKSSATSSTRSKRRCAASSRSPPLRRIVGDAVPARMSETERAEWHAVVAAIVALGLTCSSLEQLADRIGEQSQSLRDLPGNAVVLSTIHSGKGLE
jgi:superfamily I DNA/RNA helicase